MRKHLAFILILMVLGSSFALACDCCLQTTSNAVSISNGPHDCCSQIKVGRSDCGIVEVNSIAVNPIIFVASTATLEQVFDHKPGFVSFSHLRSDPVPDSIPLYLANLVLRF